MKHAVEPVRRPTSEAERAEAAAWFATLRDRLCAALEALEDAAGGSQLGHLPAGRFERQSWERPGGGGGTMAILRGGRVFEKVGVNISVVHGALSENFRGQIAGSAESGGRFWAAGISVVAHPQSPLVPAAHMNTRAIATGFGWFGGGADLTPVEPDAADTADFHAALKAACDRHDPAHYGRFKAWCDEYFFLKHRQEPRGVGGIFFDQLGTGNWARDFAFTRDVGLAFGDVYPALVRRHMGRPWTPEQRQRQLVRRGRYVEFNLLYDRGTTFGLMTGGNVEAILMSLPPLVAWP